MPALLEAALEVNINKVRFLTKNPTLDVTTEDDCLICKEPYEKNSWKEGSTLHRPVALPYGHVLGFQCLVRWVLSPNFNNYCPLCRVRIVSRHETRYAGLLEDSLVNLDEMLGIVAKGPITSAQKSQLLDLLEVSLRGKRSAVVGVRFDQAMAVWEEMLNKRCAELAVPVRAPQRLAWVDRDGDPRLVLSHRAVQIVDLLSIAGMVYVMTGLLWDIHTNRVLTLSELLLSASVCITTFLVALFIELLELSPKPEPVFFGAFVGILLALIVRRIDFNR